MSQKKVEQGVPRCKVCNRPLRSDEAIKNGMGHECAKKYQQQVTSTPEFGQYLAEKGISMSNFDTMTDVQKTRILKMYEHEQIRNENPIPTFEDFAQDIGYNVESLKEEEEKCIRLLERYNEEQKELRDPDPIWNDNDSRMKKWLQIQKNIRDIYENSTYHRLLNQYKSKIVNAMSKNYTPLYSGADYPIQVDYHTLNNMGVVVHNAEFDGKTNELRVFTELREDKPLSWNHPSFYETVTFRKEENGDTVVRFETEGVYGGDIIREKRNPEFDPNNLYETHLYQLKEDFEAQTSVPPVRPPEPKDLESIFKHGYDCDYPIMKDEYKKYGVDIKGVRYYEPTDTEFLKKHYENDTYWQSVYDEPIMAIRLHDQQDGDVEIRYSVGRNGGVVTTVTNGDKVMNFDETSKDWLYHPTHIKYHSLFKETHRDYKAQNQELIRTKLEDEIGHLHRVHQSIQRDLDGNKYTSETLKERRIWEKQSYENKVAKLSILLDSLKEKKEQNIATLKEVIKKEEGLKIHIRQKEWELRQKDTIGKRHQEYFGTNPFMSKIKGYFAKQELKREGILP